MEGFKIVSPKMRKMLGDLFDGESNPKSAKDEKIKAEDIENIEIDGVLYVTTARIAKEYEVDVKIIANNFNRNKDHYIEGKHYICLQGEKLKAFKTIHQFDEQFKYSTKLYLWTERGAFLHAKSLNVDKAWEAYEKLVEVYFRAKKAETALKELSPQLQLMIRFETEQKAMRQDIDDNTHRLEAIEKKLEADPKTAQRIKEERKGWSEREKDYLRKAYALGQTDTEIAADIGRTVSSVRAKRYALDLGSKGRCKKHWNKREDKKLLKLIEEGFSSADIAKKLGRTAHGVQARRLKLRKEV